jgi:hypothetical protein
VHTQTPVQIPDGGTLVRPLEPAVTCALSAPPSDAKTPLGPFVSSTVGGPVWVAPALDEPAPVAGPVPMPWEEEDGDPAAGLGEEGNALAYGFESPAADETATEEVSGEPRWINFDEESKSGGDVLDEWFAALEVPADDGTFEGAALAALDALGAEPEEEPAAVLAAEPEAELGEEPEAELVAEPEAQADDEPYPEFVAEPEAGRAAGPSAEPGEEPVDLAFEAAGRRPAATEQPDYDVFAPGAAGFEMSADDAGPQPDAFGSEAATTHALRVAGRLQALGDELARSGEDALARWVREGDRFDTLLAGVVAGYLAAREE